MTNQADGAITGPGPLRAIVLQSTGFGSSLYDPEELLPLAASFEASGDPGAEKGLLVNLEMVIGDRPEMFIGDRPGFQPRFVPEVEQLRCSPPVPRRHRRRTVSGCYRDLLMVRGSRRGDRRATYPESSRNGLSPRRGRRGMRAPSWRLEDRTAVITCNAAPRSHKATEGPWSDETANARRAAVPMPRPTESSAAFGVIGSTAYRVRMAGKTTQTRVSLAPTTIRRLHRIALSAWIPGVLGDATIGSGRRNNLHRGDRRLHLEHALSDGGEWNHTSANIRVYRDVRRSKVIATVVIYRSDIGRSALVFFASEQRQAETH
jgi:hypothetical protein